MKKKCISFLLTLFMVVAIIPIFPLSTKAATSDWLVPWDASIAMKGTTYDNHSRRGGTALDFAKAGEIKLFAPTSGVLKRVVGYYPPSYNVYPTPDYGNNIEFTSDDGYTIVMAHLSSVSSDIVSKGVGGRIEKGEYVGQMGNTGGSYGQHLHFEVIPAVNSLFGYTIEYLQSHFVSGGVQLPSKPALDFDRSSNPIYKIAKNQQTASVKFSWNETANTACYDLRIYDWNSKLVKEVTGITNTNTWEVQLPKGNYSAVLFSRNTIAQTEGNWVTFQVVDEPQIRTNKTKYVSGESITVSWDTMSFAEAFDLYVYDWSVPANLKYSSTGIYNRTSWTFTLPTGNYSVVLFPKNQYGSVESNWVPFQVLDSSNYKSTVTFNSQGGSEVTSITAAYNSTITEPEEPAKKGYSFGGWFKEAECINAWDFTTDIVTSDITLYAKWIDICDIDNDGKVSILDLASTAQNFNTRNTDVKWNARFDFDKDGMVDIFDLVTCSKRVN